MNDELIREMTLSRNGVPFRGNPPLLRLLKMVLVLALRDRAERIRISRTGDSATMDMDVHGEAIEMVPPPAHIVDELAAMLTAKPQPWYRRWLKRPARAGVPETWRGWFEIRARGVTIAVDCDILPHTSGVHITFGPTATAEHLAMLGLRG